MTKGYHTSGTVRARLIHTISHRETYTPTLKSAQRCSSARIRSPSAMGACPVGLLSGVTPSARRSQPFTKLGEMQRLNPLSPAKNCKLRHHQLLSREGRQELECMMIQIVAIMKVSQSWEEFVSI